MTGRAVVFSAVEVGPEMACYLQPGDFIVACDAGYRNAARLGVRPDLIVGDFDSAPRPQTDRETIVLPHVKDDTDTQFAAPGWWNTAVLKPCCWARWAARA